MRDYTKMTDAELIKLISRLDERAFETLYDRYEKQVYSLAYFKLKNAEDAADATQEAFVKLWQRAETYSGIGSVAAFILTVAKNTVTDHLRRKNDETVTLTFENDDGETSERELADTDGTPEDEPSPTERYIECDLLIIDDLGTELTNQFTQSVLYNLLDGRINRGRSTVISTNLTGEQLRRRYTDRIASRLFGGYLAFVFRGEDVRMKKIRK